jgi:hypothetical protein
MIIQAILLFTADPESPYLAGTLLLLLAIPLLTALFPRRDSAKDRVPPPEAQRLPLTPVNRPARDPRLVTARKGD